MAIDTRAFVTSTLGTVISAELSDDYLQGSGLIKTAGNCVINGLISPTIGSKVNFYYTKNNITRLIPRTLRVLSYFADPFRLTTSVQLGCKLTYLSDLQEPIDFTAYEDPFNEFNQEDNNIVIVPLEARAVMERCLDELGLTASSVPLTNRFSVDTFDLSDGYVDVLSNLLVSESYAGYLDANEVLQIFKLYEVGGTAPVIDGSSIIDAGEVGVGQLPGDAVIVSYNTLKLKQPDGTETTVDPDEEELFEGVEVQTNMSVGEGEVVFYKREFLNVEKGEAETGLLSFVVYPNWEEQIVTTYYEIFIVREKPEDSDEDDTGDSLYRWDRDIFGDYYIAPFSGQFNFFTPTIPPGYKKVSLLTKRTTERRLSPVKANGRIIKDWLKTGRNPPIYAGQTIQTELYTYDEYGTTILAESVTRQTANMTAAQVGVPFAYKQISGSGDEFWSLISIGPGSSIVAKTIRANSREAGVTTTRETTFGLRQESIAGQITKNSLGEDDLSPSEAIQLIDSAIFDPLVIVDVSTSTSKKIPEGQAAPSGSKDTLADGDPNNGFSTPSVAQIELAYGDPEAQRRIEFQMPYAPDDTFFKKTNPDGTVTFTSKASDADQKARLYGLTQNRFLIGNRNGMNIQTVPERLPQNPMEPFYIVANGIVGTYLNNAMSWTVSDGNLICSVDALYWGVAGTV